MNKEILEWLNEKIKNYRTTIERFERAGWSDEGLIVPGFKKDLKIVLLIKKELEEKDKLQKELESKEPKKKEILDDVEKRYLKNVIRPFKNRIIYIKKRNDCETGVEYLHFKLMCNDDIYFPYFKKDTMYKEMVSGKEYTLNELGIKYE